MTDGTAADALGGDGGEAAAAAAAAAAAGGEPGGTVPAALPGWMESLAADSPLRQNSDLLRMGSIEDVAKGYAETRAWAKGRIALPADDAGWSELGQKLRGESVDAYNIEVPEGQDRALADSFRQFAFDQGLPPRWAEATAKFFNVQQGEMLSQLGAANQQGIESLKLELGPEGYARRVEATNKMLAAAGIDVDVADKLAQIVGADGKPDAMKALKALFTLAEKTGELGKVDGADVALRLGTMSAAGAKAEIEQRSSDMTPEGRRWFAQAKIAGTPEHRKWNELNMAQARGS